MFFHYHPYEPFLNKNTKFLIIGTLPPPRFCGKDLKLKDVDFCYGSKDNLLWQIINKIFKDSKGKKIYLGEWHTHPEDYPTPSGLDKKSILEQIRGNILNSETIFMLIIGRKGLYISYVEKTGIKTEKNIKFEEF